MPVHGLQMSVQLPLCRESLRTMLADILEAMVLQMLPQVIALTELFITLVTGEPFVVVRGHVFEERRFLSEFSVALRALVQFPRVYRHVCLQVLLSGKVFGANGTFKPDALVAFQVFL